MAAFSGLVMFQSTHSLRSATTGCGSSTGSPVVSIHALLAECDQRRFHRLPRQSRFNPRTPCGVRQEYATANMEDYCFNPRTPCGVRLRIFLTALNLRRFNPRTPCGVRPNFLLVAGATTMFQSTHSLRSATEIERELKSLGVVSIHALLAECDGGFLQQRRPVQRFNPRTPCGVRHQPAFLRVGRDRFQSTHSLRSATAFPAWSTISTDVSIHALLAECDVHGLSGYGLLSGVSIHALLAECDRLRLPGPQPPVRFNPRTPCGVRPPESSSMASHYEFQSTHSLRSATWLPAPPACLPIRFQSTHSLRSATATDLIHYYSTEQIILCANLPKKTVIARLHFLSIYLSIFYSQCITPIADLPGNSCELEVGAQAIFHSL